MRGFVERYDRDLARPTPREAWADLPARTLVVVAGLWWRTRSWWFAVVPALAMVQSAVLVTSAFVVGRERPDVEHLDRAAHLRLPEWSHRRFHGVLPPARRGRPGRSLSRPVRRRHNRAYRARANE